MRTLVAGVPFLPLPVVAFTNRFSPIRWNHALVLLLFVLIFGLAPAPVPCFAQQAAPPASPNTVRDAPHPNSKTSLSGVPPAEHPQVLQQMDTAIEELTSRISPAVVQILVTGYGVLEESTRGQTALVAREHAIGSGVIVDSSGYIVTNAHVVEGAQRIHVALSTAMDDEQLAPVGKQRVVDARLIGVHKDSDLALLKIEGAGLPTLSLGTHRPVHQGQLVFAMGSPEGLQNSVTMGVVSSVGRQADPNRPLVYIQTDAPINPGNSGGPLVDIDGYVIGINTFILSEGGGSEGLGFAIPAEIVNFVYESLRKYGHVHRVEVKAGAQTITPNLAAGLGLSQNWGVVIDDVVPNGPADAAGLRIEDIVVSLDDRPIGTLPAFTTALYFHRLDQSLKLEVLRANEKKILYIPAIESKDSIDSLADLVNSSESLVSRLGVLAITLNDQVRSIVGTLRNSSGVIVVARVADFIGVNSGLQAGDVIHSVNQTSVDSLSSLRTALSQIKRHDPIVLQVERDGGFQWLAFGMD